ncbi:hypothetical protein G6L35_26120 [Agrobacterium tumefaciens]|nr:hypothetical protein [Agrobacterium tumefaciens]NSZ72085.1 hypothetical protein [Agrobacterium tumefaciens]
MKASPTAGLASRLPATLGEPAMKLICEAASLTAFLSAAIILVAAFA